MRLTFALALPPEIKGMHLEFMFLDDPLGSSDEACREKILNLLNTEVSQSFKQIFLLSHIGRLDDRLNMSSGLRTEKLWRTSNRLTQDH